MRQIAVVMALAGLFLGACATPQQRADKMRTELEAMAQVCYSVGFQPRTPEMDQCAMQLYSQQQASDAQRRAIAAQAGLILLQSNQRPVIVDPAPTVIIQQPPAIRLPTRVN